MRGGPAAAVVVALVLAGALTASAQQQGSIQLSTESQVVGGDPARRTGEEPFQPDFGFLWQQPGARFGQFVLETRGTRRGDEIHLGRTWVGLRDAKKGGVTWSFEGGDLYASPSPGDYQFSNLSAPAFTFSGGAVTARHARGTLQVVAGRTTALRNIFGTDPQTLDQAVGLVRASLQPNRRLQLNARAARTRTTDLKEFTRSVDDSSQAGGGARVTVTPWLQVVADGSYVRYRATGAALRATDYSYLVGGHLLLSRGWVQVNANRFSPGDLPVVNAPLQDRSGLFATGEYDIFSRLRLFGGWETIDTNIHPAGVSLLRPTGTVDRGYGGARVRVGQRSSLSVRLEEGDRLTQPAPGMLTRPAATTSDTGVFTTELQTNLGKVTGFARYSRRENVDASNASSTYTQHDGSGQAYVNLSQRTQLFGIVTVTHQASPAGSGSTFLQVSAGGQQRIKAPGLWLRIEGTKSENRDLFSGLMSPRDALNLGLNGQLTRLTTIGVNVYVDRAPIGFTPSDMGWLTRSTFRITHTIPTGSVRVASLNGASTIGSKPARGTGSVLGSVFADWNANGVPDAGEDVLAGIPVRLGSISHVTTARDGQFAFLNVPAGAQHVGLDLNALPIDFDPPPVADVIVELARGDTRRVAFGLVPLGSIHGHVFEDANKNGQLDVGEPPMEGAVLVLDGGQRSELAKKGAFRFDAVRAGEHRLTLLKESLPEGAAIVGDAERAVAITHDQPQIDATFLVRIEKRPEVRKVFPPKIGANVPSRDVPAKRDLPASAGSYAVEKKAAPPPAAARRVTPSAPVSRPFTIQIAALDDPLRAKNLTADLKAAGFPAYLVEPTAADPDGPYRIRVGRFATRAAAQGMAARLEKRLGEKMWVTRGR